MSLAIRTLHDGDLFSLLDCRCSETERGFGAEEGVDVTQVVLPRAGHFVRKTGSDERALEPGIAAVFAAGESQRVRHPLGCGDRCTVLVPSDRAIDGVHLAATERVPLSLSWLHARLVSAAERRTADALAIDEAGVVLLDALRHALRPRPRPRRARATPATAVRRRQLVLDARAALAESLGDSIGLTDVASRVGCSPYHLCRVFHAETGTTLSRHRLALRLLEAEQRIAAGAGDLTQVALALGFADHAHLTNSFRRAVGRPPSRARGDVTAQDLRAASKRLQAEPRART